MSLSSFIAWRYLRTTQKDRNISFMIRVCFLGIVIGTFSLMLTLIVMNGFEKVIHEKIQGISAPVLIHASGKKIAATQIKQFIEKQFGDDVAAMSSSSINQVIIDRNKNQSVLFFKGVEPQTEALVSSIGQKITLPGPVKNLEKLLTANKIIIGHKTARQYNLKIGDELTIMVPEPTSKKKIVLNKQKVIISGIFNVGLDDYDSNFAYCSLDFLRNIFDEKEGAERIALTLKTPPRSFVDSLFSFNAPAPETLVIEKLRTALPQLSVHSWKDLYPELVSSLKLEKYLMFFLLALISLVACMSMVSLLFMQIQQKRHDIAIFKAMGLAHAKIKSIFLYIGLIITLLASTTGLLLAAAAGYLLERYPLIEIPDVYYVTYLPARMDPEIFIVVFACTLLLGFIATWIPAQRTKRINIAQVLRQE